MKIVLLTLCFILLSHPCPSNAEAHATLTMTTNNVGRWFSKNQNNLAVQANADYQHKSGAYVGASLSNVDFEFKETNESAHIEAIPYFGWSFKLPEKWRIDAQWSRYVYDGIIFGHPADYNEYYLFLHYHDLFSGRISFADDYYALGNYAIDYELTGKYPISDQLEFSASFGYSQTKAALGSDYPYWNMGATYFYKFAAFDLRYMDADETSIDPNSVEKMHEHYDPPMINTAIVFSISLGF